MSLFNMFSVFSPFTIHATLSHNNSKFEICGNDGTRTRCKPLPQTSNAFPLGYSASPTFPFEGLDRKSSSTTDLLPFYSRFTDYRYRTTSERLVFVSQKGRLSAPLTFYDSVVRQTVPHSLLHPSFPRFRIL